MARHRPAPAPGPDLRALLAEHYFELAARSPDRIPTGRDDGTFFAPPWRRRAEALIAGEDVEVGGWELKRWRADLDVQARYRLNGDGTVTHVPHRRIS